MLATWREKATGPVTGKALDCGHFVAEEQPEATLAAMRDFFVGPGPTNSVVPPRATSDGPGARQGLGPGNLDETREV